MASGILPNPPRRRASTLRSRLPMTRFLLFAALGVSACTTVQPPGAPYIPDGLLLTADRMEYGRGDSAQLLLRNGASAVAQTGVLECAQIEAWQGGTWATSPVGNDRACILILATIQPGETMTGTVPLDVPAGTYRLTQSVGFEDQDAGVVAATAPFRVR